MIDGWVMIQQHWDKNGKMVPEEFYIAADSVEIRSPKIRPVMVELNDDEALDGYKAEKEEGARG